MGMEPNSLSRILKSLEAKGAIYKRKDPDDKRKVYICLSEYGMQLREIAFKRLFDFEKLIQQRISEDKIKVFFEVMNQIPSIVSDFRENK